MIPQELNITIDKALTDESRSCARCTRPMSTVEDTDQYVKTPGRTAAPYVDACSRCRDFSQKAVDEYVPLSRAADGTIVTQFINDNAGGTWTSENGLPRASDA